MMPSLQEASLAMKAEIADLRAALASRPAEVDDEGLPPLPKPMIPGSIMARYSSEQFRQGQRDAREYQRKVDEKIIARRDQEIADLRFNIGELMKAAAPSHTTNKENG
ncbi:hypothetical protein DIR46_02150 [Massilia oculi]|uniref:Uncharacterized protein n=2 Tax=Massilia oculi TaxID=945844 RepID=A0A2S2DE60_9BURK|nr:hypothetical protein DIR46_02150 [Massilia oculi]